nr:phospholipase D-like domain-containing protein [uncultured Draconibacterium sp.]
MELIQPAEISGKIMTLIDQAKEEIILVSPYNKFTYWKKLTQRIEKAKQRGVKIKWYIRKNVDNNVEQIRQIGIEPIEIENLHCKLYLNEQHAVVTSMNLHEYSDTSSIDIGYLITEKDMYKELTDFIDVNIDSYSVADNKVVKTKNIESPIENGGFMDSLITFLLEHGFEKENIKTHENSYGAVLTIHEFMENFKLILEPKGVYYRIDLRIHYPYKIKNTIYDFLKSNEYELNSLIGFEIDFGRQMKRLKLDLEIFENYEYENWDKDEFEKLKPVLTNLIEAYKIHINKAVLHVSKI